MGDFNQGTNFVPAAFQSALDLQPLIYTQLKYAGGSTAAMAPPQKHDRYYVHNEKYHGKDPWRCRHTVL